MNRDQQLKFDRVIKELTEITGIAAGGATETTLINILTVISKEVKQDTIITVLGNIFSAIAALKDGEFRLLSDPNDNNRLVAVNADMTDPSNPIYNYKYIDDNSPYTGSANDLEPTSNELQTAINNELIQLNSKLEYKSNGYTIDLTTSVNDPWVGFPFILISFQMDFNNVGVPGHANQISFNTDAKTISNELELAAVLNEHGYELVFDAAEAGTALIVKSGNQSAADLVSLSLETDGGELQYTSFLPINQERNSSLDYVLERLEQIQLNTEGSTYKDWEYQKGNRSKEITYFTGVTSRNPSGNKNIDKITFKIDTNTVLTQLLDYDIDDDVIKITSL